MASTNAGRTRCFFPHGIGHLLGLDVHDMEDLGDRAGYARPVARSTRFGDRYLRLDRDLAAGMAVTIEPGFYHVPAILNDAALTAPIDSDFDRAELAHFADVRGIRIEDDVVVTNGEPEVLSAAIPKAMPATSKPPCGLTTARRAQRLAGRLSAAAEQTCFARRRLAGGSSTRAAARTERRAMMDDEVVLGGVERCFGEDDVQGSAGGMHVDCIRCGAAAGRQEIDPIVGTFEDATPRATASSRSMSRLPVSATGSSGTTR